MKELELFKRSLPEDEWAGNYILSTANRENISNLVRVVFGRPQPKDSWRVGVWGNDDFGMIKDFNIKDGQTEEDADKCFLQVISLKIISQDTLTELGFETF